MENKTILVIGGTSGIGLALVKLLHENGATVITASRESTGYLEENDIQHYQLDVLADEPDFGFLPDTIHGLVYLPGSINLKPFHRFNIDEFQHDLNINVLGAVKVLQAAMRPLKKAKGAGVVMFSTVAAELGMGFHASIAVAKSAVEGLAKSLAAEWSGNYVRVNLVAPSITDTPLAEELLSSEDKREASAKRHPLRRVGQPEDMARAAAFLLSDESSWMTGQTLHVDGGMSRIKLL